MNSIYSNNADVFRKLLKHLDPNERDNEGNSCVHLAAGLGNLRVLRICIEECGIKDEENFNGIRALHVAENPEVIEYLVVQNYDVNAQDKNGWTPLYYNIYLNKVDNMRILLQIGADILITEKSGIGISEFTKIHYQDLLPFIEKELEKLPKTEKKQIEEIKSEKSLVDSPNIVEAQSEDDEVGINQSTPIVRANLLRRNSSTESVNLQLTPKIQTMLSEILMKTPSDAISLKDFGVEEVKFTELKLREILGQGAYGKVHRGYFRGSEVAIKIIDTEKTFDDRLAKEFIREIESLLKIRHNRFLLLLAVCIESPLCIVTELSKGGNLGAAIDNKILTREDKLKIALQIAEGIHYIHSKSPPIVHRDIKPQNILLDEFKQVKIADLGLSRAIEKVSNTEKINSTRVCAGTVRYMAPELYYEEPICYRPTDVWAYGCVLLHLFSEHVPWTGLDLVAVQRRLILKQPLLIEDTIEEGLKEIVKMCCRIDPEERIGFQEIRIRLLDILGVQNSQL